MTKTLLRSSIPLLMSVAAVVPFSGFAVNGPPTAEERQDEMHLWLDEPPDQTWQVTGQYPTVPGTEHAVIFRGDSVKGSYNHHAQICHFGGRFHAVWSNQRYDEDGPGQRVLYATSPDGLRWDDPREIVPSVSPEAPWERGGAYCAAGAFVVFENRLFASAGMAMISKWQDIERKKSSPVCTRECGFPVYRGLGRLYREIKGDGSYGPLFCEDPDSLPSNLLVKIEKRMKVEPRFSLPRPEWGMGDVLKQKGDRRFCEPTAWKAKDGRFTMLLRDDSNSYRKWIAFSDDGWHWTKPRLTDIGDARTMACNLTLDDGTVLLICNPRGRGFNDPKLGWRDRDPMTISVSTDGLHFSGTHTVKEGYHRFTVPLKGGPRCRGGSAAYPCAIRVGDYCHVIYSNGKEDIGTTRIPLKALLEKEKK